MPIRRRLSIGVICARRTVCSSLKVSRPQQGLALCVQRSDHQSAESHGNRRLDHGASLHRDSFLRVPKIVIIVVRGRRIRWNASRMAFLEFLLSKGLEKIRKCNRECLGRNT
jgi:hypothetical protein